jgi:PqqD family protein of HPr-rel-A system
MEHDYSHLRDLALSDSGFVFDPLTGHTFTVNGTGRAALGLLKDGLAREEIAGRLAQEFATDEGADVARDVHDFVLQLRECGLVK